LLAGSRSSAPGGLDALSWDCLGGKLSFGKAMHLQTSMRHLAALCKHLVTSIHPPPRGGGQSMVFAASARRLDGSDLYAAAGFAEHTTTPRRLDSVRENTLPHELRQAQRISAAAPPRRTNVADSRPSFQRSAMQPAMKSWLEKPAELRRLIHLSWSYTKQIDTPLNLRSSLRIEAHRGFRRNGADRLRDDCAQTPIPAAIYDIAM
jgi:hypothetical protein